MNYSSSLEYFVFPKLKKFINALFLCKVVWVTKKRTDKLRWCRKHSNATIGVYYGPDFSQSLISTPLTFNICNRLLVFFRNTTISCLNSGTTYNLNLLRSHTKKIISETSTNEHAETTMSIITIVDDRLG